MTVTALSKESQPLRKVLVQVEDIEMSATAQTIAAYVERAAGLRRRGVFGARTA